MLPFHQRRPRRTREAAGRTPALYTVNITPTTSPAAVTSKYTEQEREIEQQDTTVVPCSLYTTTTPRLINKKGNRAMPRVIYLTPTPPGILS